MVVSMEKAREAIGRRAQIVKDAAKTPQGRKLIDLIAQEFGDPQIQDSQLRSFANLGNFEVVTWLTRMENFNRGEDE